MTVFLLLGLTASAQAVEIHALKSSFDVSGSTTSPNSMAVDKETENVYLLSMGGSTAGGDILRYDEEGNPVNFPGVPGPSESQTVHFESFSTGDLFTLTCPNGETTAEIEWNSNATTLRGNMQAALEAKCGAGNYSLTSGPNNPVVKFEGAFAEEDVPQMTCTRTAGAGACEITNEVDGAPELNVLHTACGFACRSIAIDNSGGANQGVIYVSRQTSGASAEIAVFLPSGESAGTIKKRSQAGDTSAFCGVAVDDEGSVYASHSNFTSTTFVDKFEPLEWETNPAQEPEPTSTIKPLDVSQPCKMGVDSTSALTVKTGTGSTSTGTVVRFPGSSFGPPVEPFSAGASAELTNSARDVTVDLTDDTIYVTRSGEVLRFDSSGTLLEQFGGSQLTGSAQGLAVNEANGDLFVSDFFNDEVSVFEAVQAPLPTTEGTSSLLRNSVTIEGHVEPDGAGDVTDCFFEYGTSTSYGETAPCSQSLPYTGGEDVDVDLTGLTTDTTYHYRVVAKNATANSENFGEDMTFTTPTAVAGVATEGVSEVTKTSATLHGSFEGDGLVTEYTFEYGPTSSYGNSASGSGGSTVGTVEVSENIGGLETRLPTSQPYHYRLIATNSTGTSVGPDQTFYTAPPDDPVISNPTVADISNTSAKLTAEINPGLGPTVYLAQYGPTTAYGTLTPVSESIGEDESPHEVTVMLTGLSPKSTYHVRIAAINWGGTTLSADQTIVTKDVPTVGAAIVTEVGQGSARVTVPVAGNASPTAVTFEYTAAGGAPLGSLPVYGGAGLVQTPVSTLLTGLAPGTTYYVRAIATNGIGSTPGPLTSFVTAPIPQVAPPPEKPKKCRKGFKRRKGKCVRKKCRKGFKRRKGKCVRKKKSHKTRNHKKRDQG